MNTNSNTYTIAYASILVVVVAFLLAFVSSALSEKSAANERIDKKKSILSSLNIRGLDNSQVESEYASAILQDMIVNDKGEIIKEGKSKDNDGFKVSMKDLANDNLPIYICQVKGATKYVIPMKGKGLWGPVYGYLAINDDKQTVFGSFFYHDSETAGLGAIITEPWFQEQFQGKKLFGENGEAALTVVKKGAVKDPTYECDGISGATLTINGVATMLSESLNQYKAYFIGQTNK